MGQILYQLPEQRPRDVGGEICLLLLGVNVLLVTIDVGLLPGMEVAQLAVVSLPGVVGGVGAGRSRRHPPVTNNPL